MRNKSIYKPIERERTPLWGPLKLFGTDFSPKRSNRIITRLVKKIEKYGEQRGLKVEINYTKELTEIDKIAQKTPRKKLLLKAVAHGLGGLVSGAVSLGVAAGLTYVVAQDNPNSDPLALPLAVGLGAVCVAGAGMISLAEFRKSIEYYRGLIKNYPKERITIASMYSEKGIVRGTIEYKEPDGFMFISWPASIKANFNFNSNNPEDKEEYRGLVKIIKNF